MNKLKYIVMVSVFCFLFRPDIIAQINQSEVSSEERKIKISWEEVGGAVSYKILIKDLQGNTIISKDADSNNLIVELQPDTYRIRIGSVNKFGKLGSWSDWADLVIEKPLLEQPGKENGKETVKEPEITGTSVFAFKIGIGASYFDIQPDWDEYYKDTFNAYSLDIAYAFRRVNFPSFLKFMKYTGMDIESNYVKFSGKKEFNRVESDMTSIISGMNVFVMTNFDFPLNFALRGGGGLAYTILDYKKYDPAWNLTEKGSDSTYAYYYKAGLSVECRIYSRFFIEAYADYYLINYKTYDFKTLRYSCLAGIRF
ncbi:MAG: hypothetical protein JXN64_11075 [Spirochaetes bacterium]|nr:hypothetical protein [Spirochaetota bacterium]